MIYNKISSLDFSQHQHFQMVTNNKFTHKNSDIWLKRLINRGGIVRLPSFITQAVKCQASEFISSTLLRL